MPSRFVTVSLRFLTSLTVHPGLPRLYETFLYNRDGSLVYLGSSQFAMVAIRFVTVGPGYPGLIYPGRTGELNRDSEDIA